MAKTAKRKARKLTEACWAIRLNSERLGPHFRTLNYSTPMLFRTQKDARKYKREYPNAKYKKLMAIVRVDVTER